ncbi:Ribokinase [Granulibacter bethesdensis]|uniref:Ribokinase n=1 Tax=Granulibacter bethesdensis TaxID=364410 RepID=A0AAC9K8A9_9PROT|nr:ribokinase [Granulibacter bethesdensis]APH55120.1 Ribokinase [Granulibacter bethesdensis]APH62705.1 Ribokinase [Granulibacter bethesdensis]
MIVFGSINLDLLLSVPSLPEPGQTLLALNSHHAPGGKGANQAVAAARDGASVRMIGAVGDDGFAEAALYGLQQAGVDLGAVRQVQDRTGLASICIDHEGRNHIVVAPGANRAVRAAWIEENWLLAGTVLVTQMEVPPDETASCLHRAKQAGMLTVLNLAPAAPLPLETMREVDILVINEDEAAWLARHLQTNNSVTSLHALLGSTVIKTLGADGVHIADAEGTTSLPAFPVSAIDTTGAGDCFVGVLAAALEQGASTIEAARRAIIASALCCTRPGAQTASPTQHEIEAACGKRQEQITQSDG